MPGEKTQQRLISPAIERGRGQINLYLSVFFLQKVFPGAGNNFQNNDHNKIKRSRETSRSLDLLTFKNEIRTGRLIY